MIIDVDPTLSFRLRILFFSRAHLGRGSFVSIRGASWVPGTLDLLGFLLEL